jgi:uncharacterized membrane protein YeaQ/YmgE (transglycosylase-associated protein family)
VVGWLGGWLVDWLAGWLFMGWLVGWLGGSLVGWLVGWMLMGWLVGWLANVFTPAHRNQRHDPTIFRSHIWRAELTPDQQRK